MNCEKCGKKMPENIDYCPTCNLAENSSYLKYVEEQKNKEVSASIKTLINQDLNMDKPSSASIQPPYVEENVSKENTERAKKSGKSSVVSFCLAIIPYLLFAYCFIVSGGSADEGGAGAVWWYVIIYFWTVGFPIMIASLIFGIVGWKSKKSGYSYAGVFLTLVLGLFLLFIMFNNNLSIF